MHAISKNSGKGDLSDDRVAWAEYEYRVAQQSCADCGSYHAMWGYVHVAGLRSNALDTEYEKLERLIARHAPAQSHILIAGAADAKSLALIARATKDSAPGITVADRCDTPLAVCRAYAQAHGLSAATSLADFTQTPPEETYDLVFAHMTLMYVAKERRAAFLRNLGLSLTENGTLLLIHQLRFRKPELDRETDARLFAGRVLAALADRGVRLPDEEARFRQGLEDYCMARRARDEHVINFEEVESHLAAAGFRIAEAIDYSRPRASSDDDTAASAVIATRIFAAAFQG